MPCQLDVDFFHNDTLLDFSPYDVNDVKVSRRNKRQISNREYKDSDLLKAITLEPCLQQVLPAGHQDV